MNSYGDHINELRGRRFHRLENHYAGLLALTIAALTLSGCSSFNRAWNEAKRPVAPTDSIEGRWEGNWLSAKNGHQGKLRCIVTANDDSYSARFRATYMKISRFSYSIPLEVTRTNDLWYFRNSVDLGKMAGGVYEYEGTATSIRFHSTYTSKYDHGDFEMSRPGKLESSVNNR